jgi:hypothetical protein
MKAPIRILSLLFGSLCLVAGGERAHAGAFDPPSDTVTISVSSASITTGSAASLTVTVTKPNGSPEADGTTLNATLSPALIGKISGGGTSATWGSSATSTLAGGQATFTFIASATGTANISVSLPPISGNPNSVSKTATISVTQGTGSSQGLQLTASTTTLPVNPYSLGEQEDGSEGFPTNYLGSPYIAEIDVKWTGLLTGQAENGTISVAVSPVTLAAYSTLDNPNTPWTGETTTPPTVTGNEFLTLMGNGPVTVTAGVGTIFVHAGNVAGTVTLTVTAQDPDTGQTISSQQAITIAVPGGSNVPASVQLSQPSGGVYINGSNGPHNKVITADVTNLFGTPADAMPGANNIQFQIVGPAGTDAQLFGLSATGASQIGTTVQTATQNGYASVNFLAGKVQGPVQIQATAYGTYSGITNTVSATTSVIVSDGQLYSLTLTSPYQGAIAVNGITSSTSSSSSSSIPSALNGTYSLTVSAIATDREGNPVLPGTPIAFGLVDSPQASGSTSSCGSSIVTFGICGLKGNPVPGTFLFAASDGHFTGNAGPGDTLIVFGKQAHGAPAGNDDLESALLVSQVTSNTTLMTVFPFNRNDTSGTSINPGPVLPYVVGRATIGNINSPALTDASTSSTNVTGVATTTMNYPISRLNNGVVIWAQATGRDPVANAPRLVTDAMPTVYPALAPLTIVVSPSTLPGNTTTSAQVCVYDAVASPVPNMMLSFAFSNLGVGTGTINGISTGSGSVGAATNSAGCVNVPVTTNGIAGGSSGTPTLTFTGAGVSGSATISAGGGLLLLATPSAFLGTDGGLVTLKLVSSNGVAVPNVQLTGACTSGAGLSINPGITGSNGQTTATITAKLNAPENGTETPGTATCTFTTSTGSPTVTVNLTGICTTAGGCTSSSSGGTTTTDTLALTVNAATLTSGTAMISLSGGSVSGSLFSPPDESSSNTSCSASAGTTELCTLTYSSTTSVTMTNSGSGTATWSNSCGTISANSATVTVNGAISCTATVQ